MVKVNFHFQINIIDEEKVKIIAPEVLMPKKARKPQAKKESIPKAFIDHIRSLGFQETDAYVLYENKDDWMGISTGRLSHILYHHIKYYRFKLAVNSSQP